MENNKRWDIKWDIKTTQIGTKFFLNLYFYFARTSRYKVDKINFAYACNTVPFLVVSMRKKYMRLQKIVGSIDFFPEACYGFCKNDLFLKMSKKSLKRGNSNKNNGKQYDWPRMLLCYTLCYDQCTVQTLNFR